MVVKCVIEFDNNPLSTFFTGQTITGQVTLHADKPKMVKGIRLEIAGFAHTHWTTSHGTGSDKKTTTHVGHEEYIKSETSLLGCEEDQPTEIMPGIHTYTFACHLPENCPTSFESLYGHIRYMAKVVLLRPWKWNQTYIKGFTVLKILDLNYDSPVLRVPSQAEAQKTFCCGPCKSQPLHMQVSVPQAGYVPGQAIAVGVLISNETNKKIQEVLVELVMRVTYFSRQASFNNFIERIVVTKNMGRGIPQKCKKLLNYGLIVPATPPTCLNLCSIIQINYFVEVTVKVSGLHLGHLVSVPVTVGNVPLMDVIQNQPTASDKFSPATLFSGVDKAYELSKDGVDIGAQSGSSEILKIDSFQGEQKEAEVLKVDALENARDMATNSRVESTMPPSSWAENPNIPLPTYQEATHMQPGKIAANEHHDYGETDFAPRYPVFSIPSPSIGNVDTIDGVQFNVEQRGRAVTANSSTWL